MYGAEYTVEHSKSCYLQARATIGWLFPSDSTGVWVVGWGGVGWGVFQGEDRQQENARGGMKATETRASRRIRGGS